MNEEFWQALEAMRQRQEAQDGRMGEIQEALAQVVQMFSGQQDTLQEFKRITNATLDRLERHQSDTNTRLMTIEQQIFSVVQQQSIMQQNMSVMQQNMSVMQQNITGLQTEIRRILDEMRRDRG